MDEFQFISLPLEYSNHNQFQKKVKTFQNSIRPQKILVILQILSTNGLDNKLKLAQMWSLLM